MIRQRFGWFNVHACLRDSVFVFQGEIGLLDLAYDESECVARMGKHRHSAITSTQHMMMLHAEIHIFCDGKWWSQEIVLGPSMLRNLTAENILTVIIKRLPMSFQEMAKRVTTFGILFASDSAKSCKRTTRLVIPTLRALAAPDLSPKLPLMIHVGCLMHQFVIGLVMVLDMFKLVNPMYCSSVLMLRGTSQSDTKAIGRVLIQEQLQGRCLLADVPEGARLYGDALLRVMDYDEHGPTVTPTAACANAMDHWEGAFGLHQFGLFVLPRLSQESEVQVIDEACDAMDSFALGKRSHPPASNKWKKLFGPTAFWLKMTRLADGAYCDAFCEVLRGKLDRLPPEEALEDQDGVTGADTTQAFQQAERKRATKSVKWLTNSRTPDRLAIAAVVLKQSCALMADHFAHSSRKEQVSSGGMIPWLSETTNPSRALCCKMLARLHDDDPVWLPVKQRGPWTEERLHGVMCAQLTVVAHSFMRSVRGFVEGVPWYVGKLVHPDTEDDALEHLDFIKSRCKECLDKYYMPDLVAHLNEESIKRGQPTYEFIDGSFRYAKPTNIRSENRFSRSNAFSRSGKQGPAPYAATVSSGHILGEMNSIHRSVYKPAKKQNRKPKPTKREHWSPYHAYLSTESKKVGGVRKLGNQATPKQTFEALDDADKQVYIDMYNDSLEGSEAEPLETHVEAHEDTAMPLWGSATSHYPMNCQLCEDVSKNNREYHKAFLREYQKRIKPSVKIAKPDPVHHPCWQKYGHKMCVRDVPDVALANRMLKATKSVQADKMSPNGLVIAHDMPLY